MLLDFRPYVEPRTRISRSTPLSERLVSAIDRRGPGECWEWRGQRTVKGYGVLDVDCRQRRAHTIMWEFLNGPIPPGLELDHLCRNPPCCNPSHLEPVTNRENVLRGTSFSARNARKTHCPQGHAYTPDNVYLSKRGQRTCRECKKQLWLNLRKQSEG